MKDLEAKMEQASELEAFFANAYEYLRETLVQHRLIPRGAYYDNVDYTGSGKERIRFQVYTYSQHETEEHALYVPTFLLEPLDFEYYTHRDARDNQELHTWAAQEEVRLYEEKDRQAALAVIAQTRLREDQERREFERLKAKFENHNN